MITLNLLPTSEKDVLKQIRAYNSIIFYGQLLVGIFLIFLILLLTILSFLNIQINFIEKAGLSESVSPTGKAIDELKKEITETNRLLADIDRIQQQQKLSPPILADLAQITPAGIQFSNFFYDGKTQKVVLDGRAATREDFLSFKSSLEKYAKISNIDSPLSNLIKSTENTFRLSFIIK